MSKTLRSYILLDRSGSMSSRWDEALSSINAYVEELDGEKAKVTVAVFDSQNGLQFDVVRDGVPSEKWKNLTNEDAEPRGMTPLFDALGQMVARAEKDDKKRSVIVVMTDGNENASREVSREDAKAMLDRCKKRDWQVVFLGADFDAFGQSAQVGVLAGQTLNITKGHYKDSMRGLAASTAQYAVTGEAVSFTDEDRTKAGT